MSRLIDADKLLGNKFKNDISYNAFCNLVKRQPSIDAVPRWILCREGLPEEKGEYLVTYHPCYWDDVKTDIRVGIDSFRGKTTWAKRKHQRVIAWMPLPKPYKEERKEE